MKEEYWELFMTSGKIDDYLNYKNTEAKTLKPPVAPYTSECSMIDVITLSADAMLERFSTFFNTLIPPTDAVLPISAFPIYPPALR